MQDENKIAPAASSHTEIQIRQTSLSASSRQIRTKELGYWLRVFWYWIVFFDSNAPAPKFFAVGDDSNRSSAQKRFTLSFAIFCTLCSNIDVHLFV
jgi:hypothetical protein